VNREAELDWPSRVACSDLLNEAAARRREYVGLPRWDFSCIKPRMIRGSILPELLVAIGTDIKYNPHIYWRGLRGFL
jgi:hypothetical protein